MRSTRGLHQCRRHNNVGLSLNVGSSNIVSLSVVPFLPPNPNYTPRVCSGQSRRKSSLNNLSDRLATPPLHSLTSNAVLATPTIYSPNSTWRPLRQRPTPTSLSRPFVICHSTSSQSGDVLKHPDTVNSSHATTELPNDLEPPPPRTSSPAADEGSLTDRSSSQDVPFATIGQIALVKEASDIIKALETLIMRITNQKSPIMNEAGNVTVDDNKELSRHEGYSSDGDHANVISNESDSIAEINTYITRVLALLRGYAARGTFLSTLSGNIAENVRRAADEIAVLNDVTLSEGKMTHVQNETAKVKEAWGEVVASGIRVRFILRLLQSLRHLDLQNQKGLGDASTPSLHATASSSGSSSSSSPPQLKVVHSSDTSLNLQSMPHSPFHFLRSTTSSSPEQSQSQMVPPSAPSHGSNASRRARIREDMHKSFLDSRKRIRSQSHTHSIGQNRPRPGELSKTVGSVPTQPVQKQNGKGSITNRSSAISSQGSGMRGQISSTSNTNSPSTNSNSEARKIPWWHHSHHGPRYIDLGAGGLTIACLKGDRLLQLEDGAEVISTSFTVKSTQPRFEGDGRSLVRSISPVQPFNSSPLSPGSWRKSKAHDRKLLRFALRSVRRHHQNASKNIQVAFLPSRPLATMGRRKLKLALRKVSQAFNIVAPAVLSPLLFADMKFVVTPMAVLQPMPAVCAEIRSSLLSLLSLQLSIDLAVPPGLAVAAVCASADNAAVTPHAITKAELGLLNNKEAQHCAETPPPPPPPQQQQQQQHQHARPTYSTSPKTSHPSDLTSPPSEPPVSPSSLSSPASSQSTSSLSQSSLAVLKSRPYPVHISPFSSQPSLATFPTSLHVHDVTADPTTYSATSLSGTSSSSILSTSMPSAISSQLPHPIPTTRVDYHLPTSARSVWRVHPSTPDYSFGNTDHLATVTHTLPALNNPQHVQQALSHSITSATHNVLSQGGKTFHYPLVPTSPSTSSPAPSILQPSAPSTSPSTSTSMLSSPPSAQYTFSEQRIDDFELLLTQRVLNTVKEMAHISSTSSSSLSSAVSTSDTSDLATSADVPIPGDPSSLFALPESSLLEFNTARNQAQSALKQGDWSLATVFDKALGVTAQVDEASISPNDTSASTKKVISQRHSSLIIDDRDDLPTINPPSWPSQIPQSTSSLSSMSPASQQFHPNPTSPALASSLAAIPPPVYQSKDEHNILRNPRYYPPHMRPFYVHHLYFNSLLPADPSHTKRNTPPHVLTHAFANPVAVDNLNNLASSLTSQGYMDRKSSRTKGQPTVVSRITPQQVKGRLASASNMAKEQRSQHSQSDPAKDEISPANPGFETSAFINPPSYPSLLSSIIPIAPSPIDLLKRARTALRQTRSDLTFSTTNWTLSRLDARTKLVSSSSFSSSSLSPTGNPASPSSTYINRPRRPKSLNELRGLLLHRLKAMVALRRARRMRGILERLKNMRRFGVREGKIYVEGDQHQSDMHASLEDYGETLRKLSSPLSPLSSTSNLFKLSSHSRQRRSLPSFTHLSFPTIKRIILDGKTEVLNVAKEMGIVAEEYDRALRITYPHHQNRGTEVMNMLHHYLYAGQLPMRNHGRMGRGRSTNADSSSDNSGDNDPFPMNHLLNDVFYKGSNPRFNNIGYNLLRVARANAAIAARIARRLQLSLFKQTRPPGAVKYDSILLPTIVRHIPSTTQQQQTLKGGRFVAPNDSSTVRERQYVIRNVIKPTISHSSTTGSSSPYGGSTSSSSSSSSSAFSPGSFARGIVQASELEVIAYNNDILSSAQVAAALSVISNNSIAVTSKTLTYSSRSSSTLGNVSGGSTGSGYLGDDEAIASGGERMSILLPSVYTELRFNTFNNASVIRDQMDSTSHVHTTTQPLSSQPLSTQTTTPASSPSNSEYIDRSATAGVIIPDHEFEMVNKIMADNALRVELASAEVDEAVTQIDKIVMMVTSIHDRLKHVLDTPITGTGRHALVRDYFNEIDALSLMFDEIQFSVQTLNHSKLAKGTDDGDYGARCNLNLLTNPITNIPFLCRDPLLLAFTKEKQTKTKEQGKNEQAFKMASTPISPSNLSDVLCDREKSNTTPTIPPASLKQSESLNGHGLSDQPHFLLRSRPPRLRYNSARFSSTSTISSLKQPSRLDPTSHPAGTGRSGLARWPKKQLVPWSDTHPVATLAVPHCPYVPIPALPGARSPWAAPNVEHTLLDRHRQWAQQASNATSTSSTLATSATSSPTSENFESSSSLQSPSSTFPSVPEIYSSTPQFPKDVRHTDGATAQPAFPGSSFSWSSPSFFTSYAQPTTTVNTMTATPVPSNVSKSSPTVSPLSSLHSVLTTSPSTLPPSTLNLPPPSSPHSSSPVRYPIISSVPVCLTPIGSMPTISIPINDSFLLTSPTSLGSTPPAPFALVKNGIGAKSYGGVALIQTYSGPSNHGSFSPSQHPLDTYTYKYPYPWSPVTPLAAMLPIRSMTPIDLEHMLVVRPLPNPTPDTYNKCSSDNDNTRDVPAFSSPILSSHPPTGDIARRGAIASNVTNLTNIRMYNLKHWYMTMDNNVLPDITASSRHDSSTAPTQQQQQQQVLHSHGKTQPSEGTQQSETPSPPIDTPKAELLPHISSVSTKGYSRYTSSNWIDDNKPQSFNYSDLYKLALIDYMQKRDPIQLVTNVSLSSHSQSDIATQQRGIMQSMSSSGIGGIRTTTSSKAEDSLVATTSQGPKDVGIFSRLPTSISMPKTHIYHALSLLSHPHTRVLLPKRHTGAWKITRGPTTGEGYNPVSPAGKPLGRNQQYQQHGQRTTQQQQQQPRSAQSGSASLASSHSSSPIIFDPVLPPMTLPLPPLSSASFSSAESQATAYAIALYNHCLHEAEHQAATASLRLYPFPWIPPSALVQIDTSAGQKGPVETRRWGKPFSEPVDLVASTTSARQDDQTKHFGGTPDNVTSIEVDCDGTTVSSSTTALSYKESTTSSNLSQSTSSPVTSYISPPVALGSARFKSPMPTMKVATAVNITQSVVGLRQPLSIDDKALPFVEPDRNGDNNATNVSTTTTATNPSGAPSRPSSTSSYSSPVSLPSVVFDDFPTEPTKYPKPSLAHRKRHRWFMKWHMRWLARMNAKHARGRAHDNVGTGRNCGRGSLGVSIDRPSIRLQNEWEEIKFGFPFAEYYSNAVKTPAKPLVSSTRNPTEADYIKGLKRYNHNARIVYDKAASGENRQPCIVPMNSGSTQPSTSLSSPSCPGLSPMPAPSPSTASSLSFPSASLSQSMSEDYALEWYDTNSSRWQELWVPPYASDQVVGPVPSVFSTLLAVQRQLEVVYETVLNLSQTVQQQSAMLDSEGNPLKRKEKILPTKIKIQLMRGFHVYRNKGTAMTNHYLNSFLSSALSYSRFPKGNSNFIRQIRLTLGPGGRGSTTGVQYHYKRNNNYEKTKKKYERLGITDRIVPKYNYYSQMSGKYDKHIKNNALMLKNSPHVPKPIVILLRTLSESNQLHLLKLIIPIFRKICVDSHIANGITKSN